MSPEMISLLTAVYLITNPSGDPTTEVQILRWLTPAQCQQELKDRNELGVTSDTMPDGREILETRFACTLVDPQYTVENMTRAQVDLQQGL